jgi:hypothetical protein
MLPSDTKTLDKLMRGNARGGINVVSFANWSYKARGKRQ